MENNEESYPEMVLIYTCIYIYIHTHVYVISSMMYLYNISITAHLQDDAKLV